VDLVDTLKDLDSETTDIKEVKYAFDDMNMQYILVPDSR